MWIARVSLYVFLLLAFMPANSYSQQVTGYDATSQSQDWPWWRGPNRNGMGSDTAKPPKKFGKRENVLWKVPVPGRGHGSPIVIGSRVFLPTADLQRPAHSVLAFDLESGKQLWQTQLSKGGYPEQNHPKNTEASSTIAGVGSDLFATFFHHKKVELNALDVDGKVLWQRDVSVFNPKKYKYGYAPSPVLYKNMVIVAAEHDGPSAIVAFNRQSGEPIWRIPRTPNITFSSPVVANVAGRDQLLISGSNKVVSYDPNDGRLLWQVDGTTAATCGTMVWSGDIVVASGGYPKAETIAVRADGSGQVVWRNNKKCYEQSMIVIDGYLYGLSDNGVLYCWSVQDGEHEQWRQRLSGPVSASPVYAGGHVYWANERGTMYVFRPNSQRFDLVSENRLGESTFASPAIAGNRMLMRVGEGTGGSYQEYLYCIGGEES